MSIRIARGKHKKGLALSSFETTVVTLAERTNFGALCKICRLAVKGASCHRGGSKSNSETYKMYGISLIKRAQMENK